MSGTLFALDGISTGFRFNHLPFGNIGSHRY